MVVEVFFKHVFGSEDVVMCEVVSALLVTVAGFLAIWTLDHIRDQVDNDEGAYGRKTRRGCLAIIDGIGVLIGVAWEKCFDEASESIFEGYPSVQGSVGKLGLAVFSVVLLLPAWKKFVIPMTLHDNWRFKAVVNKHLFEKLKDHKDFGNAIDKGILEAIECQDTESESELESEEDNDADTPDKRELKKSIKILKQDLKTTLLEHHENAQLRRGTIA